MRLKIKNIFIYTHLKIGSEKYMDKLLKNIYLPSVDTINIDHYSYCSRNHPVVVLVMGTEYTFLLSLIFDHRGSDDPLVLCCCCGADAAAFVYSL